MMAQMKPVPRVLAVVPARGGSKGIPRKNLADVAGLPLLAWTLKAAQESGVVDELIVSTDDAEIATVGRRWGASVPFLRPAELGRDEVHAVHTVLHTLDWLEATHGALPEVVLMLLPTSPLRRPEDIRACVELMQRPDTPAVISVTDMGKYLNNLRYLDGDALSLVDPNVDRNGQRQTQRKIHAVNGSIFAARPALLRAHGSFHIDGARGHAMDPQHSIDINGPQDLALARDALVRRAPAALAA